MKSPGYTAAGLKLAPERGERDWTSGGAKKMKPKQDKEEISVSLFHWKMKGEFLQLEKPHGHCATSESQAGREALPQKWTHPKGPFQGINEPQTERAERQQPA